MAVVKCTLVARLHAPPHAPLAPSLSPDSLHEKLIIEKNKDFSAKRTVSNTRQRREV